MRTLRSLGVSRSAMRRMMRVCVLGILAGLLWFPSGHGQSQGTSPRSFTTPEAAASALSAAYEKGDSQAVAVILGDKARRLVVSGDPVVDRHERAWFLSLYAEGHEVVVDGDRNAVLQLGKDGQPYPIPIIKKGSRWRFDPSEGHEDLLSRRISKAELTALNVVVAYVDAQREYHQVDHSGSGVRAYAQRFRSTPGRKDGLFWGEASDTAEGPIAALVKAASREGYLPSKEGQWPVYRGYVYKMLTGQGPLAKGGAREYIVDGRMTEGFALVAFPVRYGVSGIMTFLVNQEGVVYYKDLGSTTVDLGRKMTHFNPDPSWSRGQAR